MSSSPREQLVSRDKRFVWHPYTPMEAYVRDAQPLVIERASGSRLFDVNGRSYIDGNASWWTSLLGHNHPRLVRALTEQAEKFCHTALAGITHEPAIDFAERIIARAPEGMSRVFFSDNGSTAVEAAIKLAAQYWVQQDKREKSLFLSLERAFHGETLGVTALGGVEAFRAPFAALTMPVLHLPSPALDEERALTVLSQTLREQASQIAALVLEPLIQGAGGMLMYSPVYLQRARELTEKYDVLLIVDEVFTGYGRTGPFWACEQAGITPDLLATAKGLSGGLLPFAATLATERVYEGFLGDSSRAFYYGHTYCGNPLGAAVAREVLQVYEEERIIEKAAQKALLLRERWEAWASLPGVSGVRCLGMCAALDLGEEGSTYLDPRGAQVCAAALRRGAYVRPLGSTLYVTPALNIPDEDLTELCDILEASLQEVL